MFCIDILLGNPIVEFKTSLDRSAQFYGKMKAEKEMADQVLVRELPFGYRDVENDPPPSQYLKHPS